VQDTSTSNKRKPGSPVEQKSGWARSNLHRITRIAVGAAILLVLVWANLDAARAGIYDNAMSMDTKATDFDKRCVVMSDVMKVDQSVQSSSDYFIYSA